jgi:hypothetical protein
VVTHGSRALAIASPVVWRVGAALALCTQPFGSFE